MGPNMRRKYCSSSHLQQQPEDNAATAEPVPQDDPATEEAITFSGAKKGPGDFVWFLAFCLSAGNSFFLFP